MRNFIFLLLTTLTVSIGFSQRVAQVDIEDAVSDKIADTTQEVVKQAKSANIDVKSLKKADEAFDNMWYAEAAKYYTDALKEADGVPAMQSLQKAADSHYLIGNMDQAHHYYEMLYTNYEDNISDNDLFKYTDALKGIGKKDKAKRLIKLLNENTNEDNSKSPSFIDHKGNILVKNLDINSKFSDFSPFYQNNEKVIFASARDSSSGKSKRYKWNNQPFLDLYEANVEEDDYQFKEVKKLPKSVNTKYHEASVAFSPNDSVMYFTRNGIKPKRKQLKGKENKTIHHLKIYKSIIEEDGEWSKGEEVPFNLDKYSTGHPTLTKDGKKMVFVSDRPGGYGSTDLYEVDIKEDGTFSEPRNLGPEVNTIRQEMFPYMHNRNLYYSSDRSSGLGGLDIYKTTIKDGKYGTTSNLGEPINSERDDFSYILLGDEDTEGLESGYFASNRKGGKGDDDIYFFESDLIKKMKSNDNLIAGKVVDALTDEALPNSLVTLFDEKSTKIAEVATDENGEYELKNLLPNHNYSVNVNKTDYNELIDAIVTGDNENQSVVHRMHKDGNGDRLYSDGDLTKFRTEAIYFDFDRSEIRPDAQEELQELVAIMEEYGDIKLKIESHTDSRGSSEYNRYLSQNRADATREYLLAHGISPDRIISAIGYGEDNLINECSDGVSCSRSAHQQNRRSEFILVNNG